MLELLTPRGPGHAEGLGGHGFARAEPELWWQISGFSPETRIFWKTGGAGICEQIGDTAEAGALSA